MNFQTSENSDENFRNYKVCASCGTTKTPLWRRSLEGEPVCNACGLYLKSNKQERPPWLHKRLPSNDLDPRPEPVAKLEKFQSLPKQEKSVVCSNCHTTDTPVWRRDSEGKSICNACGIYYRIHKVNRPIHMQKRVQKRNDIGMTLNWQMQITNNKSKHARAQSDTILFARNEKYSALPFRRTSVQAMLPPLEPNRFNSHKRSLSTSIFLRGPKLSDNRIGKNRLPSLGKFLSLVNTVKIEYPPAPSEQGNMHSSVTSQKPIFNPTDDKSNLTRTFSGLDMISKVAEDPFYSDRKEIYILNK